MPDELAEAPGPSAGRGTLAIGAAKLAAMLLIFGQQIALSALLGADLYGEISRVLAWLQLVSSVVVASAIQGVSSVVARAAPGAAERAFRSVLRVHVVIAVGAAALFAAAAGPLAAFASAPQVAGPLRISSLGVLGYGLTAPFVGAINGHRRFGEHALFDVGHAFLRAGLVVAGAALFARGGRSGVLGATVGLVVATAVVVPIALGRAGTGRPGGAAEAGAYLGFLLPVAMGQAALSVLTQIDSFLLSRYLGIAAVASGRPVEAADALVGVYRGVTLFAVLPYQLMSAVSLVLFPTLARASAAGDREAVRVTARAGFRLALILTGLGCSVLAGLAPQALALAFADPRFADAGGTPLRVLSIGMGGFAMLAVTSAALASLGRERQAAALTFSAIGLVATGVAFVAPRAGFGADMLVHTAAATSAALVVTAAAGGVVLARAAGAAARAATVGRVLAAFAIAAALGAWLPRMGRASALFEAPLVGAAYVLALVATRELGAADVARVRRAIRLPPSKPLA